MVKNTSGGNKTKGQARKSTAQPQSDVLRLPTCPDELVARVLTLFGDGRCAVLLPSGKELACVIRKKFRGRLKRNHCILVNGLVLVGLRDWEAPNHKTCDVLEVYPHEDTQRLLAALPHIATLLAAHSERTLTHDAHDIFDAAHTDDTHTHTHTHTHIDVDTHTHIDIDDI
jgi:hypothetical protein